MKKKESLMFWIMIIVAIVAIGAIIFMVVINKNLTGNATSNNCVTVCTTFHDWYHCHAGPAQGNQYLCDWNYCNCLAGCYPGSGLACAKNFPAQ